MPDNQIEQPGFGFEEQIDPNTDLPIQDPTEFPDGIDPNTGLPFDPDFVDEGPFQEEFPQDGDSFEPGFEDQGQFQPAVEEDLGEFDPKVQQAIQSRGVPGQTPHTTFPSQPCNPQQHAQGHPPANQSYEQNPAYQSGGYDPYAQPAGQDTYGQDDPYAQTDPYAQQAYPQNAYGQPPTQQDPYAQQGYSDDPYAQQNYPQDSNTAGGYSGQEGAASGIGLDVVMLKKTIRNGATVMLPIKDGDVLKDGRGKAQAGDKFRIMFRPHTDGYVYVVAIDGSGWAQGIFPPPTSPLANPVNAGQEYSLPEGTNWFSLDQFKGIETLFFVASPEKRPDIEEIVANIAGKERHPKATPQQVTEAPIILSGYYRSQTGSSPFIIGQTSTTPLGQDHNLIPTTYFTQKAGEALRVTRWFRHE